MKEQGLYMYRLTVLLLLRLRGRHKQVVPKRLVQPLLLHGSCSPLQAPDGAHAQLWVRVREHHQQKVTGRTH
jgi:hypothetical protein